MRRLFTELLSSLRTAGIDPTDSEEQRLNKSLLIFASALMGFAPVLWLAIYWAMGIRFSASIPIGYQIVSVISLLIYLKTKNFPFFRFCQVSLFLFVPFIMQWSIGSYVSSSGVMLWALLAPIGMMMFDGPRQSIPWFIAYILLSGLSGFFDYYLDYSPQSNLPIKTVAVFFVLNFTAMSTIIYLLFNYFVREKARLKLALDEQHRLLSEEQKRSERLLLNILPEKIAQRLKRDQTTIADGLADVTVMFVDVVGFTRLAEGVSPNELVSLLNKVFSLFDELVEKYQLEKIKTIGDAYMVAGGLTGSPSDYTLRIVTLAQEIRELAHTNQELQVYKISFHVGISTGPVVGGVIGTKKFSYDLWGNTVNTASRLSSDAAAGEIQVDAETYERTRNHYKFEGPHIVNLKGKRQMEMYRLLARRPNKGFSPPLESNESMQQKYAK